MLATYMQRMRNNNLEIRIAGYSCRPQLIIKVLIIGLIINLRLKMFSQTFEIAPMKIALPSP